MSTTSGGLTASTEREIERFLDDWVTTEDIPGCSVAVFDADGLLYTAGLGARDMESNAPATPDTLYHVGSITKIATAIAVLQLIEREAIALDDAVDEYVPFLRDAPGEPVTVRDLLTHSSGIPSDAIPLRDNIASKRDLQLHINGVADKRITDDPPFMYLNSGFKLLGELVAAVDGRPYTDYVTQEVLTPLGMDRSTFDQARLFEADDAMTGYESEDDERVPTDEPLEFETQPADGGLISSVPELTRLVRCLLNDGTLEGTQVLSPESVAAMMTKHVQDRSTVDGDEMWYGFGLDIRSFLGDVLVGHGGAVSHSQAYVGGLTDRQLGVAVAVNTTGVADATYGHGVLALAAGEDPIKVVPGLALEEKLGAVAGTYESFRGPTVTVETQDGHITIDTEGDDEPTPAFPTSTAADDYTFYTVQGGGVRDPIEFRETDDGLTMLWERLRLDAT